MNFVYRPIVMWPGELKRSRKRATFKATWGKTLMLLDAELRALRADNVVFQIAVREENIRLDGKLRPGVKAAHPGVILSFDSRFGPLSYPCDTFSEFDDNVRAIALALEALRKVQRYGVGLSGEQYTGWKAIGSANNSNGKMTPEHAAAFIVANGDGHQGGMNEAYRRAMRNLHPDRNSGDESHFKKLQEAKDVLGL